MDKSVSGFRRIRGHTIFMPPIGSDSLVIDAGAHRGEFAHELHALTNAHCMQIEPHPQLFENLNPPAKGSKIHAALSDADGEQVFAFDSNLEGGSIARKTDTDDSVTVKTVGLNSLLEQSGASQIDLLKLDIEGAEFDLISRTPDEIWHQVKQISVEFHDFLPEFRDGDRFKKAAQRLSQLGFRMRNMAFRTHGDVVFVDKSIFPRTLPFVITSLTARLLLKIRERQAQHHANK